MSRTYSRVQLARDPYGRADLIRARVYEPLRTCAWCGRKRRSGNLFRYSWETDSGRTYRDGGDGFGLGRGDHKLFCGKSCRDCYYG